MKLPSFRRKTSSLVSADTDRLIAAHGDGAYNVARTRAREERQGRVTDGNRARGHWDKVPQEIARRTGRQVGLDTATRYSG
jgi:hypothetical protein